LLQILREEECYFLFRLTHGSPKKRRIRNREKKPGVCGEARKWPVRWKMFRTVRI